MNAIFKATGLVSSMAGLILLSACVGMKQKLASESSQNPLCHFFAGRLDISWVSVYDVRELNLPLTRGADSLPKKFIAFKINTQSLNSFLTGLDGLPYEKRIISFPVDGGNSCLSFHLEPSGLMSEALQKKYPNIKSFKGLSSEDPTAQLRLDFDGRTIQAAITHHNKTELITPWEDKAGVLYYLLYNKEAAGYPHIPIKNHY